MQKLTTPFYRIKEKELLYDIHLLQDSLQQNWGNFIAAYSVKTNSLPWLLTYLKKQDFYAEVVSDTEYDLVRRLGYAPERILYNGPIKNREIFETILLAGGYVNMDSSQEPDWMEELSKSFPDRQFSIGVRVNVDIAHLCPKEVLAQEDGGRFGYCYENKELEKVINRMKRLPNVALGGLHLHSSTKSRTLEVFGALAEMAGRIAEEYNLNLSYVDMGGGYFGGRDDMPGYPQYFEEIGRVLKKYFNPQTTKLIAEPGVSLISRATSFETTVRDIKNIRQHCYLVTDGSRVNLNPQVTRHAYPHHIEYEGGAEDRSSKASQWVCGFTCMEYDRLFEIKEDRELKIGDRVIYDLAGGYTMCLNPLFIQYLPPVYIEKENGSLLKAREKWGNEEYLQKNYEEGESLHE